MTLALVSLGLISFPTKPVEILVAVSIIVAAIHAIRPLMPRGELLIAGVFGLVHGTAFATTILDLNLGFGEKILAILGFNVGVELAQLTAAVLVLPLLILLSHARAFAAFRTVVAGIAIVAAAAWIVGISTDQNSALQPVFDEIARFPIAFYLALVVIVVGLWYFTRARRTENTRPGCLPAMSTSSTSPMMRRLRRAAGAPARGVGALVLMAAFLAPAGTAFALIDDDPPSSHSEVVVVRIPDRAGTPPTSSPSPSPTPSSAPAPRPGGAGGELPDTGVDSSTLWSGALLALGAALAGTVLVAARHRRTRQRAS